jgi:hypothetical protein
MSKELPTSNPLVQRWECGEIEGTPHMFEDELGCWVAWDDHKREIERLRALVEKASRQLASTGADMAAVELLREVREAAPADETSPATESK